MQRLGSPWLAQGLLSRPQRCRHETRTLIYQSPSQIERNRRYQRRVQTRYPRRKSVPLFELPDLVLDLDAEGNPKVRSYSHQDEKDQADLWSRNSKVDALGHRMDAFRKELAQAEEIWRKPVGPLDPRRISRRDLLSVALLGAQAQDGPATGTATSSTTAGNGKPGRQDRWAATDDTAGRLRSNGFPRRVLEDDIETANLMLHWLDRHYAGRVVHPDQLSELQSDLKLLSFPKLRRVASLLLQTDDGAKLLSLCGPEIYDSLVDTRRQHHGIQLRHGADPEEVLVFVNNVTTGLRARGIACPAPLSELGLWLASKVFDLAAISNYLLHPAPKEFSDQPTGKSLGAETIKESLGAILGRLRQREITLSEGELSQLFSVLSGHDDTPEAGVTPSFRAVISNSDEFREAYKAYVLVLGEMGALRSVWHEWWGSTGLETPRIDQGQILFASAALRSVELSGDRRQQLAISEALELATGNYAQDRRLDSQLVSLLRGPTAEISPNPPTGQNTAAEEGHKGASEPLNYGVMAGRFLATKQLSDALAVLRRELGGQERS